MCLTTFIRSLILDIATFNIITTCCILDIEQCLYLESNHSHSFLCTNNISRHSIMENDQPPSLTVPITDHERAQSLRSNDSVDDQRRPLSTDATSVYSQPYYDDRPSQPSNNNEDTTRDDIVSPLPAPTRFESFRRRLPPPPSHLSRTYSNNYAPISPIDEEPTPSLRPPSTNPDRHNEDDYRTNSISALSVRTIPQSTRSFQPLVPLPPLWTPFWLYRSTIAGFAAFFTIALVVLIVVWVLSNVRDGFEVHADGPHHAWWAYVPTVLVVLLVGAWRCVDYHVKALVPWDELQAGPVSAGSSLLVDYVGSLQIMALGQGFARNYWGVVATTGAFVGLKIITVFSTGLFILLPREVGRTIDLRTTGRFDGQTLQGTDAQVVNRYFGTTFQGLPREAGVTNELAYALFRFDGDEEEIANRTLSAEVDAFVPTISCRVVETKLDGNATVSQSLIGDVYGDGVRFTIPDDSVCDNWPAVVLSTLNPEFQVAPSRQVYGLMRALNCGMSTDAAALLFSVLDLSFVQEVRAGVTQLAIAGEAIATSSSRTVNGMTNVLCEASHVITRVQVTNDTRQNDTPTRGVSVELVKNSQNRTLHGLSDASLMTAFETVASSAAGSFGQVPGADTTSGFFNLLAMHLASRDVNQLLEGENLRSTVETSFKGVMAEYAHQALTQPDNGEIQGEVINRETRYVTNEASAAVMVAAILGGIVASIMLLFRAPRAVVPRDPGSIAAAAATLTNSVELNRLLRRGGVPNETNQEASLNGYEFGTAIATTEQGQASFKIVTSEGVRNFNAPKSTNVLKWWHPITASFPFLVMVAAVPVLFIGLLEFTQSKSADGIVEIPDNLATDIYTHYIPSLVMVIVASLVNLVDFNVALFTPWLALAKGGASHKQSILAYYLGMAPPVTLFKAFKTGHINVVLSTLATVIASILAIVAAGLYNGDAFTVAGSDITLVQSGDFDLRWTDSALSDNGAAGLVSSILHDNFTYPPFTHENLVFPAFSLINGDLTTRNATVRALDSNISAIEMPAVQADLQCYLVDRNLVSLSSNAANTIDVSILATLPENCQLGGSDRTASSFQYTTTFNTTASPTFIGRQFDLLFGLGTEFTGNVIPTSQANLSGLVSDNPPVGCPSLAFTFGTLPTDLADASTDTITSMLCYQRIVSLKASFHLISNTTTIDPSRPVNADASDASLLPNPLFNSSTVPADSEVDKHFDFRIQSNLARGLLSFPSATGPEFDIDPFFQGVLNTPSTSTNTPPSPADLIGEPNETALLSSIVSFYRLYLAQAISLNMRSPLSTTNNTQNTLITRQNLTPLASLPTTLTTTRLIQNRTSTTLLQILLALTAVLTLSAHLLTKFRHVLPLNPLPIANKLALLAGSDLAHNPADSDEGICECCGKPRTRHRRSGSSSHQRPDTDHDEMYGEGTRLTVPEAENEDDEPRRLSVPVGVSFDARTATFGRDGLIPPGAEWLSNTSQPGGTGSTATGSSAFLSAMPSTLRSRGRSGVAGNRASGAWENIFAGRRYSMGWWAATAKRGGRRRFGVDVGERADDGDEGEWELGKRKLERGSEGMRFESWGGALSRATGGGGGGFGGAGREGRVLYAPPPPGSDDGGGQEIRGYEMHEGLQERGRRLNVPGSGVVGMGSPALGGGGLGGGGYGYSYGEGGLRGSSRGSSAGRDMRGTGIASSERGSREGSVERYGYGDGDDGRGGGGSVDMGDDGRQGLGMGMNFSRGGGYQRVGGDGEA